MSESTSISASSIASTSTTIATATSDSRSMHFVGLDVHQKRSSICILDANGKQVKRFEVKGHWPAVLAQIEQHVPRPFAPSAMRPVAATVTSTSGWRPSPGTCRSPTPPSWR